MKEETHSYKPKYADKTWEELSEAEQEDFMNEFRNEIKYYKEYNTIFAKWCDKIISDYEIKQEKNRYKIEQRQKNRSLSKLFQLNESLVIKNGKITEYIYRFGNQIPAVVNEFEISSDEYDKLIKLYQNKSTESDLKEIEDYVSSNSSYTRNFKSIFERIMSFIL